MSSEDELGDRAHEGDGDGDHDAHRQKVERVRYESDGGRGSDHVAVEKDDCAEVRYRAVPRTQTDERRHDCGHDILPETERTEEEPRLLSRRGA